MLISLAAAAARLAVTSFISFSSSSGAFMEQPGFVTTKRTLISYRIQRCPKISVGG